MDAYPPTSLTLYPSLRSFVSPTSRAMPYPPTSAAIYPRQPHRALLIHDVLDLIVEVVRHDPMTLKRWALVDKRWYLLVRPRLFRKVVINSDEHLFDVLDAFGRLDWLPRVVKELSLGQGSKISRRAQESCDARHLRRLKSVHTLGWYAMDWDALATRPENRDAILALFARVHTLTLYNVVRSTDQFLEFVGCFPALARLQVGGISTWATGARHYTGTGLRPANVPRVLPRPRPATLCLDWDMFIDPKLWTGLRSVVDFSGLTELQAGNCAKQVTDLMGYLGDECRESLETLDLNVDFNYLSHWSFLGLYFSVGSASRLRHLRIQSNVKSMSFSPGPSLARFISAASSESLERVDYSLNFASHDYLARSDWTQIATAIQERQQSRGSGRSPLCVSFTLTGLDHTPAREDALVGLAPVLSNKTATIHFSEPEGSCGKSCQPCFLLGRFCQLPFLDAHLF